ncbi:MAG: acetyl-CoA carboxylase biotin carboxyl carrier protein [Candidatus Gastranaerophilales bacterium]|nr:acetyl-CoA carboxylase biotin carboxyl carrier protein [Candidatus Gastranaerophilales bacterium]
MRIEFDYIEKLAELVSKNDLSEITVEDGDKAVTIRKERGFVAAQPVPVAQAAPVAAQQTPQPAAEAAPAKKPEASNLIRITSPMVGTFYRSPAPGAEPFTAVGKTVSIGQVVCIIEAMKLMNEIESEVSGKVVEICVDDGQPVEFGQTLMVIEP